MFWVHTNQILQGFIFISAYISLKYQLLIYKTVKQLIVGSVKHYVSVWAYGEHIIEDNWFIFDVIAGVLHV